ncbi:hypothetical protein IP76_04935 [Rhizobium sp. AAP43]|nr:hypothetical protein IP76_04935 [Rhizobium sp. AAP43]
MPAPKKSATGEAGAVAPRSTATSAAAVVAVIFGLMLIVPTVVLWIGRYSPELGALFGAIALMSIFVILWLRSRYQQSRNGE